MVKILNSTIKILRKIISNPRRKFRGIKRALKFYYYRLRYGVDSQKVVFESFVGKKYTCNPRAIYEQMLNDGAFAGYKFVWSFHRPKSFSYLKDNVGTSVVKKHSNKYIKECATSKYIIVNFAVPKYVKPNRKQVIVQTWHGKPLKRIGCDFIGNDWGVKSRKKVLKGFKMNGRKNTYILSPSPDFSAKLASAYNLNKKQASKKIVETGYPRNDYLFKYRASDITRIKLRLSIPLDKKVILYAPTWRGNNVAENNAEEINNKFDLLQAKKSLGDDYVILVRAHHTESKYINITNEDGVFDVTEVTEINELYIISDMLISDYSGAIFDFANLKKPMILFVYDREQYEKSPGLYFDIDEFPAVVVYDKSNLTKEIESLFEGFYYDNKYKAFNKKYNPLDGSDCSIRTLDKIINIESIEGEVVKKPTRNTKIKGFLIKFTSILRASRLFLNSNYKQLLYYKNKHKGERCFLVGNGPSLTASDLDLIKDEICFGCNMISKAYDYTDWRPTYHCMTDVVFTGQAKKIVSSDKAICFQSKNFYEKAKMQGTKNVVFVQNHMLYPYKVVGNMLKYYSPSYATVMSFVIELAMFMGFSKIYLIGVDCTNPHKNPEKGHFIKGYRDAALDIVEDRRARRVIQGKAMSLVEYGDWMVDRSQFAFDKLNTFAEKKGCKVYNSTRGGDLRAFERVKLEDALK